MSTTGEIVAEPRTRLKPDRSKRSKKQPPYHVILLDDDDHTYDYVIGMVRKLFGYANEHALQLAVEVDQTGRVILDTTTMERAELKRDQIHAFGRDWRIPRCEGSMSAAIEPAED
ncbi:MAG: ATP-dependent Clp protease adaptor ClpS [Planctomycetota bacterium]|jgi:ATP-dependent Clp protease adaptor protein ClpS